MADLPALFSRTGGAFADPVHRFLGMDGMQRAQLAHSAPAECHGGSISNVEILERCIESICAAKGAHPPARLWGDRPPFFDAVRPHMGTLQTLSPQEVTAFRHHLAQSRADMLCKDPPNDGNRAVVTEGLMIPVHAPAAFGAASAFDSSPAWWTRMPPTALATAALAAAATTFLRYAVPMFNFITLPPKSYFRDQDQIS